MKVIYEISLLGLGYANPSAQTGIYRVIENVAYGLTKSNECDLSFCSCWGVQCLIASLDFLNFDLRFKTVPLPHAKLNTAINRRRFAVDKKLDVDNLSGTKRPLLRGFRKALHYAEKLTGAYHPVDPQLLQKADIFHSPFMPIPEAVKNTRQIKRFLTVYDLVPVLFPDFFVQDIKDNFTNIMKSLDSETWVLCISHATKNDLCNYRKDLDPAKVFVTPLAASDLFYRCSDKERMALVRAKYAIPDAPYILSLSTLEPRKNIDHTIRCFAKLVQEQNIKDLYLVLVGATGWKYEKIFETISNCDAVKERIIFTGRVADEDLAAVYSGALAFVYPSFYEGFGLPPLEAMQCGVPVITSNTSSLPEVVGDAGIMLDPTDVDGLCHSLLEIYRQPSLQAAMSRKSLERAKQFSWERCTQDTVAAYKASLLS